MRRSYLFPLVASVLSLSCAQFMSVPVEPGSDKNSCENRALIEDAEDADDQLPAREGRKGYWYTFKDDKGTEVLPRDGHFVPASGGVGESSYALRVHGKTAPSGEVYAGFGVNFYDPKQPYDASRYDGVSFLAKKAPNTVGSIRVKLPDANTDPDGKVCSDCYNDFGLGFELTDEWTRYTVKFTDLKQEQGWGTPRPETVAANAVFGLQWQVSTPNAEFDVWFDDIRFEGCK
jgi:endoglucanase